MGCVYKVTNKTNNKIYIGKTINSASHRFSCHKCDAKKGSKNYFHSALVKYGFNNFDLEIIFESNDNNELLVREEYFISFYKSNTKKFGYNILKNGSSYNPSRVYNTCLSTYSKVNGKKSAGRKLSGNFVGVSKNGTGWSSIITRNNTRYNLGVFNSEEEAAQAYDIKSIELDNNTNHLNFPELIIRYQNNDIKPIPRPKQQVGKVKFFTYDNYYLVRYLDKENNLDLKRKFKCKDQALILYEKWLSSNNPPQRHCKKDTYWLKNVKKPNSSSKFHGVTFSKKEQKWQASIRVSGKNKWLGYFNTEMDAALSFDSYVKNNKLQNKLNFPDLGSLE